MNTAVIDKGLVSQFLALAKPRVVSLIVFCAVIGMFLATTGLPSASVLVFGTLGIGLTAGSAAAVNCLIEQRIDAVMARTRARPLPSGTISSMQTVTFAFIVGGIGLFLLHAFVNPLTMWLTFATFVGYAVIYTVLLKPNTPQNIVIGGASGAMPPVLGWAAVTGQVTLEPVILFLIIFVWTPPHFWALSLYRREDYLRAHLPMLPVTHGEPETRRQILLYSLVLVPLTLAVGPIAGLGWLYVGAAAVLGALFVAGAYRLWRDPSVPRAMHLFRFSILYLFCLFLVMTIDAFLKLRGA